MKSADGDQERASMTSIVPKSEKQKDAEAEVETVKEQLGPFVVAAEETRMAMVFTDATEPSNPIIFANDAFLALTGYLREEVLGQDFNFLMTNRADDAALSKIRAEFAGDTGGIEVLYHRKDGQEFWAAVIVSPVCDDNGSIIQHFSSFVDLTKHIDEQSQLRRLVEELNHRVKNTLATVQSIVLQALGTAADPKRIADAIQSRLYALSRSHDLLTRENWKSAGLRDLIEGALEPFEARQGEASRISMKGDDIRFPPQSALALSVAFNELATNALKYGALSIPTGTITIDWHILPVAGGGQRLVLSWQEAGGPSVTVPTRKGFGTSVLERGLAHELGGTAKLEYKKEGLKCMIDVPVPADDRNG